MQLEVALHCSVVALAVVYQLYHGYIYSLQFEVGQKWDGYAPGLKQGWLFGRRIDLSDDQWRDFRHNVPLLTTVLFCFLLLSKAAKQLTYYNQHSRTMFYVVFAVAFLIGLHGACAVFPLALVVANYYIAHAVGGTPSGSSIIWLYNLSTLLAARVYDGFPFASLHPSLSWLDDGYRGSVRWHICYNLTVLRMLSFALDLHWAKSKQYNGGGSVASNSGSINSSAAAAARTRQRTPLPDIAGNTDYSLGMCMAHALYPPLYLAGPIVTFQDFAWQVKQQQQHKTKQGSSSKAAGQEEHTVAAATSRRVCTTYALRLFADVVCIELLTHFLYFNSIAKYKIGVRYKAHGLVFNATEIGLTGWWVLTFMWLKFAVIWRLFRLAALLDGIEVPENMVRCFANNYDVQGFWRGWHASFNKWLVRYLYVPLGGSGRPFVAVYTTFLFVALWHDLEWHLLGWASLICLAFLPELLLKRFAATSPVVAKHKGTAAYRHVCALFAALNIAALMSANLAGFAVGGIEGIGVLWQGLLASPVYVLVAFACFYSAAQVMFYLRS